MPPLAAKVRFMSEMISEKNPAPDRSLTLPTEFDDAVVWAAWLYYADQLVPTAELFRALSEHMPAETKTALGSLNAQQKQAWAQLGV